MPFNNIYYQEKEGKHAVVFVSPEISDSIFHFSNYRIFETEELARRFVNELKPIIHRVDALTAMTMFMMYTVAAV